MQRQGGNVRNPGGEPFGFIGSTDARKSTVRLDLPACHDSPPLHHVGYAPPIPILSLQSRAGRFASRADQDSLPAKGHGSKSKAREF